MGDPKEVLLKACQYPMPFEISFDWRYGKDMSEVHWVCTIHIGETIYGKGRGDSQIGALKGAIHNYEIYKNRK